MKSRTTKNIAIEFDSVKDNTVVDKFGIESGVILQSGRSDSGCSGGSVGKKYMNQPFMIDMPVRKRKSTIWKPPVVNDVARGAIVDFRKFCFGEVSSSALNEGTGNRLFDGGKVSDSPVMKRVSGAVGTV